MTARELALRLAKYLGLTSLDPSDPSNTGGPMRIGLVDGDLADMVAAINGALQEIWDDAPAALRHRRVGTFLRAPVSVTVDLTQYSSAVVIDGYDPWMAGCSIRFAGDAADNEILDGTTLRREYLGGTAAGVPATVFHDGLSLPADVAEIVGPVEIPQVRRLEPAGSREEFYLFDRALADMHDYGRVWVRLQAMAREPGQPWAYFADSDFDPTTGTVTRLRVAPMPDGDYPITYGAKLNPPVITLTDIGVDTDPGKHFPLPAGWMESVLLPMATQRFSAHPAFGNGNALLAGEVARQYQKAKQIVKSYQKAVDGSFLIPTFR